MTKEILLSGIVSGVCASLLYSLIILLVRVYIFSPKISISDGILKKTDLLDGEERDYLSIKVINKSKVNAVNVDYALYYCKKYKSGVNEIIDFEPRRKRFPVLDRYSKSNTDFAMRISFYVPKNLSLQDTDLFKVELLFKIIVTQSFSNRTKCFEKYYIKDDLREKGFFETGKSLVITDC